jgi:hypothetical protein
VSPKEALTFVEKHGVVLQAARGSVPSLAEAVAGERIRGSWWGHPKGRDIYSAAEEVCASPDVLVCKLVEGKITYVHRRLWPALVKLASRFPKAQLAKAWNEHTSSGAHRSRRVAFPAWVPDDVARQAQALPLCEAEVMLSQLLTLGMKRAMPKRTNRRTTVRDRRSPARRRARRSRGGRTGETP